MLPEMYFSVSATTRDMRSGEVDGVDYDFVGPAGFQRLIDDGELLEWAEIHGGLQRSGTRREPVETALAAGKPVVVEVDLAGARAMKAAMPEGVTVFLAPPSMEELERRLRHRGTETGAAFARRLQTAREEMAARDEFDITVISDEPRAVAGRLVELLVSSPSHPLESSS